MADDFTFEPFESQTKLNHALSVEVPSLLSANQLIDLVRDPFFIVVHFCVLWIVF